MAAEDIQELTLTPEDEDFDDDDIVNGASSPQRAAGGVPAMATPTSLINNIQADASPITQMFRVGLPEVQEQFTELGGIGEVPEEMWNVSKYDIESLIPNIKTKGQANKKFQDAMKKKNTLLKQHDMAQKEWCKAYEMMLVQSQTAKTSVNIAHTECFLQSLPELPVPFICTLEHLTKYSKDLNKIRKDGAKTMIVAAIWAAIALSFDE